MYAKSMLLYFLFVIHIFITTKANLVNRSRKLDNKLKRFVNQPLSFSGERT